MTRIVIILDVEDVDPTLEDPHEVADDLLDEDMPTFEAGASFRVHHFPGVPREGTFVSAEWAP